MTILDKVFFTLLRLPSTTLHELLHASMAFLFTIIDTIINFIKSIFGISPKPTTKITSFNLIPNFKDGTLGSVGYINANSIQSILINIAPLLSWASIPVLANFLGYIEINYANTSYFFNKYSPSLKDILFLIISIQLLWSGKLSKQDLSNVFEAIFSFDFLIKISIIIFVVFVIKKVDFFNQNIMEILTNIFHIFQEKINEILR